MGKQETYGDIDDLLVKRRGGDQPGNNTCGKTNERTTDAAHFTSFFPGNAKGNWADSRAEDDPHECLQTMSGTRRSTDIGTDVKPTHGYSDVVENNTGDTHHKGKDDNLLT
jgi:hypothetical protein